VAKKWVVMLGIILTIVGVCLIEHKFIQDSFEYLLNEMNKVEAAIVEDEDNINTARNINLLESVHATWKEKSKVLKMIVWHTGIKEVEVNLSRLTSYVNLNNSEEALVELHQLEDFCKHYKDDFVISLENVL